MKTNKNDELVLCVDPSIRALGWAMFQYSYRRDEWTLYRSGGINNKGGFDWIDRVDHMVNALEEFYFDSKLPTVTKLLIELPSLNRINSDAGEAAANTGAIIKLMGLVFAIRQNWLDLNGVDSMLVPVGTWKGNVPKKVTQKRVKKHWDWSGHNHNEADAVGIGDWYIRKYLPKLSKER